ncbi:MAG: AhpC/TSA family protein [Bacteroidales bacterium]|nr:AhpC/TSA family protein [Bacteroidales bacterium]
MKKLFLIVFFYGISLALASAQQPVNIQIKLSGLTGEACLFVNYFGTKQYVKDTLSISKESVSIKRDSLLEPGMYCLVSLEGNLIMDFFIDRDEQQFSMTSSLKNLAGEMKVKNSENNALFYQWINQQADFKQKKFEQQPKLLVSRFMKALQDVEIPFQHDNGDEIPQPERLYYAQHHFFDNLRLDDEDLLRTPLYGKKLEWYFNNMMTPTPDSVIKYADMLIEQAKESFITYKYVVWQASYYAETSTIMGMERAFVHIIDKYYAPNDSLALPDLRDRLMKRADELRHSLVGAKAPNMMIQDSTFVLRELHEMDTDFVIIYFFDPDCGHCKAETDTLVMFYQQEKENLNFDIYAVCNDTSMQKMKQYIQTRNIPWTVVNGPRTATKHYSVLYDVPSMPTLYMMDKDKIIIAKRLSPQQMIDMMRRKK